MRLRATVLSVAIVANPNSQFPIGNIGIGNWQHLHIGNIYTLVLQAPLPSIPTFSRRPRSGRFRVARRGLSCPAVRRGPTGLKEGAAHTARRSLKP